jgi:hypothetical protein
MSGEVVRTVDLNDNVVLYIHLECYDGYGNIGRQCLIIGTLPSPFDNDSSSLPPNVVPRYVTKSMVVAEVLDYVIEDNKNAMECGPISNLMLMYRLEEAYIPVHKSNLQTLRIGDLPLHQRGELFSSSLDLYLVIGDRKCFVNA